MASIPRWLHSTVHVSVPPNSQRMRSHNGRERRTNDISCANVMDAKDVHKMSANDLFPANERYIKISKLIKRGYWSYNLITIIIVAVPIVVVSSSSSLSSTYHQDYEQDHRHDHILHTYRHMRCDRFALDITLSIPYIRENIYIE